LEAAVWGTENVADASATLQRFLEQSIEFPSRSTQP
jgi:hypothetical protein